MPRVREKLIAAGLWDRENEGDPETDEASADVLLDGLKKLLAPGVSVIVVTDPGTPPVFRPLIRKNAGAHALEMMGILTISNDKFTSRTKAICAAALALPEFLKQQPELAAPVV
jgi:hypothetical protein